ncbi:MAG TPA: glycosyltransferase family 9 protein [Chloroflexota bacterium]|nr:glycosyltransferase family 9 protein [Chloroflexota bacterium]
MVGFGETSLGPLIAGTAREWPAVLPFPELLIVWLRDHVAVTANAQRLRVPRVVGCAPLEATVAGTHMAAWLSASLESLGVRRAAGTLLAAAGAEPAGVVIHPGSGSARKNWGGWAEVMAVLRPARATVIAGPADEVPVEQLLAAWPAGAARPSVRKELTLEQLGRLLAGAELYLGNDSGVTHLAAAVGAPTVAVFGPTDPAVWAPVGARVMTVGGTAVEQGVFAAAPRWPSVEQVLDAVRSLGGQAA